MPTEPPERALRMAADGPGGVRALAVFIAGYFVAVTATEHVYGSLAVPSPFWFPDSVLLCALLFTRRER